MEKNKILGIVLAGVLLLAGCSDKGENINIKSSAPEVIEKESGYHEEGSGTKLSGLVMEVSETAITISLSGREPDNREQENRSGKEPNGDNSKPDIGTDGMQENDITPDNRPKGEPEPGNQLKNGNSDERPAPDGQVEQPDIPEAMHNGDEKDRTNIIELSSDTIFKDESENPLLLSDIKTGDFVTVETDGSDLALSITKRAFRENGDGD